MHHAVQSNRCAASPVLVCLFKSWWDMAPKADNERYASCVTRLLDSMFFSAHVMEYFRFTHTFAKPQQEVFTNPHPSGSTARLALAVCERHWVVKGKSR